MVSSLASAFGMIWILRRYTRSFVNPFFIPVLRAPAVARRAVPCLCRPDRVRQERRGEVPSPAVCLPRADEQEPALAILDEPDSALAADAAYVHCVRMYRRRGFRRRVLPRDRTAAEPLCVIHPPLDVP